MPATVKTSRGDCVRVTRPVVDAAMSANRRQANNMAKPLVVRVFLPPSLSDSSHHSTSPPRHLLHASFCLLSPTPSILRQRRRRNRRPCDICARTSTPRPRCRLTSSIVTVPPPRSGASPSHSTPKQFTHARRFRRLRRSESASVRYFLLRCVDVPNA